MPDGAILVSDDQLGALYRISYEAPAMAPAVAPATAPTVATQSIP